MSWGGTRGCLCPCILGGGPCPEPGASILSPKAAAEGGEGCPQPWRGDRGPRGPPVPLQRCCPPAAKGRESAFPPPAARLVGGAGWSPQGWPRGLRRDAAGADGVGGAAAGSPRRVPPAPGLLRPPPPHSERAGSWGRRLQRAISQSRIEMRLSGIAFRRPFNPISQNFLTD